MNFRQQIRCTVLQGHGVPEKDLESAIKEMHAAPDK